MTSVAQPRPSPRFVCRSYMAVALAPEPPLLEWIAEIEQKIKDTGNFLVGPPVVLDLSAVKLSKSAIAHLVAQLEQRGVRVMGVENVDPSQLDAALPPLLRSTKKEIMEIGAAAPKARETQREKPQPREARSAPATLLLDKPVRSGQSIYFPDGDVTVLGSVGSGAELVAGGSIHVYGTLR